MNPFAGLMTPMQDRPCVERREKRAALPQWPRRQMPAVANPWKLSGMQCAVIDLAQQGMGKKAIGLKLEISPKTVDSHLERIMQKMDVATKPMALELYDRWANREPKAEAGLSDGTAPGGDLQVRNAEGFLSDGRASSCDLPPARAKRETRE